MLDMSCNKRGLVWTSSTRLLTKDFGGSRADCAEGLCFVSPGWIFGSGLPDTCQEHSS